MLGHSENLPPCPENCGAPSDISSPTGGGVGSIPSRPAEARKSPPDESVGDPFPPTATTDLSILPGGLPVPPDVVLAEAQIAHQLAIVHPAILRARKLVAGPGTPTSADSGTSDLRELDVASPPVQCPQRSDPPHALRGPHRIELYGANEKRRFLLRLAAVGQAVGLSLVAVGLFLTSLNGTLLFLGEQRGSFWLFHLGASIGGLCLALSGIYLCQRSSPIFAAHNKLSPQRQAVAVKREPCTFSAEAGALSNSQP